MSVAVNLGTAAPSGSLGSITNTSPLAGAAAGDFVMVNFGWAIASGVLNTVTDAGGNTWHPVGHDAANQSGGYAWSILTTGWAAGAAGIVGSLASGAPGGRVSSALKIPAGVLAASPIDTHIEGAVSAPAGNVSITGPGPLAQGGEVVLVSSIVREGTGVVPSWGWVAPAVGVSSVTGSGTTTAGAALGELDTGGVSSAPTVAYTPAGTTGNHGLGLLTLKLAPIVVAVPLITATASGLAPAREVMTANPPAALAVAQAFPASVQLGPTPGAPGMTPPWRPYFEGRNGIGFDQD